MSLTVAIIGRPNVGKSTLFNRLVGRRTALVDDLPGVTRDRRVGQARFGGLRFTVIDTAGLEEAAAETLPGRMRDQTARALAEADLALLVVDARAGITPHDRHFAQWLRRSGKPVLVIANKCEGRAGDAGLAESHGLGLGDPIPLSAEHGEGLADLAEALLPFLPDEEAGQTEEAEPEAEREPDFAVATAEGEGEDPAERESAEAAAAEAAAALRPVRLAIVGRPNVGKSTLVNALLGEERVLTGPEPGITRDAIEVAWRWRDRPVVLIDTAGLRRRANITSRLEKIAAADTIEAVRLAEIAILVLDAEAILDRQDLTIARHVLDEGRALVVAVNKWDQVAEPAVALRRLRDRLETSLPQARGLATVTISALKGRRLGELMEAVLQAHGVWNRRVPTGPLNRWLAAAVEAHPPPLVDGKRPKLRYVTQVKARPPTFALWGGRAVELPDTYLRYLVNGLREAFDLPGVPVRVLMRRSKNPYTGGEAR